MATKPMKRVSPARKASIRKKVSELASTLERVYQLSDPAKAAADSTDLELEIKKVQKELQDELFRCHIPQICDLVPAACPPQPPKKKKS